jgi:hypothetical protein
MQAQNRRPELMRKAADVLNRLSHEERESLLIKNWMSHDARWYMAVAQEFGLEVANQLNRVAAHEVGKAEARRIVRALKLPPIGAPDDYLVAQEIFIAFLGPELLDYDVAQASDHGYEIRVRRCFAYENVNRAGVVDQYRCGIFARVTGWMESLGLRYEMTPTLGKCLKAQGLECTYAFDVAGAKPEAPGAS